MRKRLPVAKKMQALFLAICLILSTCSTAVCAEPSENDTSGIALENEGAASADSSDETVIGTENESGDSSEGIQEDQPAPGDSSEEITDDSSEAVDEKETIAEETVETDAQSEPEELSDFEETGIFGLSIVDNNGTEVKEWYDSSSDVYYIFLTNAVNISDAVLNITGVKIKSASSGTVDPAKNCVTGAFASSGDAITVTAVNGTKYNIIVKQSGLPSLNLTLNGVTLDTIKSHSKDIKYPGNTAVLTDASGAVNISQENTVEIKGRGNSTWGYNDKKPYQIKFEKKLSVLGMAKAKKWILLANAFDDSMLRNKIAYSLGDNLDMRYTPDLEFIDLWVDGVYQGTYNISEKVEITDTRLNLQDPLGVLIEHDEGFYRYEDYWFQEALMRRHFVLSDQVDESRPQEALDGFHAKLTAFLTYLKQTNPSAITLEKLSAYIDIDSFAKYYLIGEYLCSVDAFVSSWFWYTDGPSDVLHLGPIWDYDGSQGSNGIWDHATDMYAYKNYEMFTILMNSPAFARRVKEIYTQYRGAFSSLSGKAAQWGSNLSTAADVNYTRWKSLGKPSNKGKAFAPTYAAAVSFHVNWLSARDGGFGVNVPAVPTAATSASVSASGKTLTVEAKEITGTTSIQVAVWSANKGQDDLKWYQLSRNADGSMSINVDLRNHGGSDVYYAHVYSGSTFLGGHTLDVTMTDSPVAVTASYEESSDIIKVEIKGIEDYSSLNTAVWTDNKGQDDLKWYSKTVGKDGTVVYEISRSNHVDAGNCLIHVYGISGGKMHFVKAVDLDLPSYKPAEVSAHQDDGLSSLVVTARYVSGYTNLQAAVWGDENGQNDLKWYPMSRNSDGSWTCTVDTNTHKENGDYQIHIYGNLNQKLTFAARTTVNVTLQKAPKASAQVVKEGEKMQLSLYNASALHSVTFAVWGDTDGQNDLKWYTGKKNASGIWTVDVDLLSHNETGHYYVHVYGKRTSSDGLSFQAQTSFDVDTLNVPKLELNTSESGKVLVANLENAPAYDSVSIALWGKTNGQNDLKWYDARKNFDGSWSINVNLQKHGETGLYYCHAYGKKAGKQTFITSNTFTVASFKSVEVTATDRGSTFMCKAAYAEDYTNVKFAVWTSANGQDDIKWYTAGKYSDGSYRFFVDPSKHDGNGIYNIHAYGIKDGKNTIMGVCTFTVDSYLITAADNNN